jgi:SAM-dependent methyltransferase
MLRKKKIQMRFWSRTIQKEAGSAIIEEHGDFTAFDARFRAWQNVPGQDSFSRYNTSRTLTKINKGLAHTTLGKNLGETKKWETSGKSAFVNIRKHHIIRPTDRVLEYGCGSLRTAKPFIEFLPPGHFFGLDVNAGFLRHRQELAGDLLKDKQVQLGVIPDNFEAARAFEADVVFSTNVATQVHPDEQEAYFKNQVDLIQDPCAALIIHTSLAKRPSCMGNSTWAWPIAHYDAGFAPLSRIAMSVLSTSTRRGVELTHVLLSYQKPI